jgi:two-component system, OmpR family, response regulator ChvI
MDQISPAARADVLVVDDDALFSESLSRNLMDAGYRTRVFQDGPATLHHLGGGPEADLMLLDWKMPGMTGIEVLQRLRTRKIDIPVIFLTVLSDQIYEEAGLLNGAVDFVEKSRSFSILLKRIELTLCGRRLNDVAEEPTTARYGDLMLRYDSHRAGWKGEGVDLTLTEFDILAHLVENADRDVSYRELYDIVHGEGFVAGEGEAGYRTNVRAFIKRIRQKFHVIDAEFSLIRNYPGFGYRWCDERGQ